MSTKEGPRDADASIGSGGPLPPMDSQFHVNRWKRLRLILQSEAAECGLACLAMIACYHGHSTDLPSLRRRFSMSLKGISVARMAQIAHTMGFEARALRAELSYLPKAQMPCILHWDLNHFVVLGRITAKGAEIHDPAGGTAVIPLAEVSKHFTGIVMELVPGPDFAPIGKPKGIPLSALTGRVIGFKRILAQVTCLALAIEILSLSIPFQMQWVVDQVLVTADVSVLTVMTLGFLIVMIAQIGLSIARGWVLSWLGATVNAQWITNLFGHLLSLPLDYFEKRHMGDILSRFTSVRSIQTTMTGNFLEAILDGVMGSLALMVLCIYSIPLTCMVLAAFAVYVALRWLMYRTLWRVNEEQLACTAKQQTELMESIRGIQAIKLANKQSARRLRLGNATQEAAHRDMQSQRISLAFGATSQGIFGIQRILLISFGAYFALSGKFSAGMLIAATAFADQFTSKIGSLVDRFVEFRMLRLHLERISDIALTSPEAHAHGSQQHAEPEACIELKNLSFRYAEGEPWILKDINALIRSGESLAIVGPSGCGKTTLAKLILGLLKPTEGSVEVGGIDITHFGLEGYREMCAAVMQDDHLFAGTIAENISFFEPDASMEDIQASAIAAAIHEDIGRMPMQYESLVGDMGSSLSGGQKQRVLLARALFRKPKLIVLDEATSHLDVERERHIMKAVSQLSITRIVIAHRSETIARVDRVLELTSSSAALRNQASATSVKAEVFG